jgi:hypothetical protein
MARIGLATSPLPRECSTTEPHGHLPLIPADIRAPCANPAKTTAKNHSGAGEGNRTLVVSLEGFCSTIELHPRNLPLRQPCPNTSPAETSKLQLPLNQNWWRGTDSNHRTRKRADLQSAAFNHSATPPVKEPAIIQIISSLVKGLCVKHASIRQFTAICPDCAVFAPASGQDAAQTEPNFLCKTHLSAFSFPARAKYGTIRASY